MAARPVRGPERRGGALRREGGVRLHDGPPRGERAGAGGVRRPLLRHRARRARPGPRGARDTARRAGVRPEPPRLAHRRLRGLPRRGRRPARAAGGGAARRPRAGPRRGGGGGRPSRAAARSDDPDVPARRAGRVSGLGRRVGAGSGLPGHALDPRRVRRTHRVGGGQPDSLPGVELELAGERPVDGRGHDRGGDPDRSVRGRRLRHPRRRLSGRPRVAAHRGDLRRRGRAGLERRLGRRPRRVPGRELVPGRHRGRLPPRRRRARHRRAVLPVLAPARRRRGNERGGAAGVVSRGQHPGRVRAHRGLPHRRAGHRRDAALRPLSAAVRGGAAAPRPADRVRRAVRLGRRRPPLRGHRGPAERARHPEGPGHRDGRRVHRVGLVLLVQSGRPRRRRRLADVRPGAAAAAVRHHRRRRVRGRASSTTRATRSAPPSAICTSGKRRSATSPASSTCGTGSSGSIWRGRRRPSRSPPPDG